MLLFADGLEKNKILLGMMRYAIDRDSEKYPDDIRIIFRIHDESSRLLAKYLFPDKNM